MPLTGPLSFTVLIDPKSIEEFKQKVVDSAQLEVRAALTRIAEHGVDLLSRMETARGHEWFAKQWTCSPIVETQTGLMTEILSKAEEMIFFSRTGKDRQYSSKYPINGRSLLEILEGGAGAHSIGPRDPNGVLAFDIHDKVHKSRFAGTSLDVHGFRELSFKGPEPDSVLMIRHVWHPGFAGNHFVATTRELIEQGLAIETDRIAQGIADRVK